jgi:hypothetical protein
MTDFNPQSTVETPAQQPVNGQKVPEKNGPQSPSQSHVPINPLTGKRYSRAGLLQAYELRDLAWGLAKKLGTGTANETEQKAARDVTGLIRAWSEADDRVRIHRNKPLPGTLRPKEKRKVCQEIKPLD